MRETLRIHAKLERSRANGPGPRAVIWLQGCPLRCPGCFNPGTWDTERGEGIPVHDMFHWIASIGGIEGLTISGGEPTEQIPALVSLLKRVRQETPLSVILFSGRRLNDIIHLPQGEDLLSLIDILIDGPFEQERVCASGVWPSSSNQRMHFLAGHYRSGDFSCLPLGEVLILEDGQVCQSGWVASGTTKGMSPLTIP